MSIYVHVPFCHSKCLYCAFYSVATTTMRSDWCNALCNELVARKSELQQTVHNTLYFGGGTPSLLTPDEWNKIIQTLEANYVILKNAERTLEANPEDVTPDNVALWRGLGFNRISIGVQSLNPVSLKTSLRRHTAEQAIEAVICAHKGGFDNISVDFILGISNTDDLQQIRHAVTTLPITHISLYILSIDEGSILFKRVQDGTFKPLSDDLEAKLYISFSEMLKSEGFEHYEISNFAKRGYESVHNSAYWEHKPYLGFGPSAHSYNGDNIRRWNVANLKKYIETNGSLFETETLTTENLFNELIMTGLRTSKGLPLNSLQSERFIDLWNKSQASFQKFIDSGHAFIENGNYKLNEEGWLISDAIFGDLFADTK